MIKANKDGIYYETELLHNLEVQENVKEFNLSVNINENIKDTETNTDLINQLVKEKYFNSEQRDQSNNSEESDEDISNVLKVNTKNSSQRRKVSSSEGFDGQIEPTKPGKVPSNLTELAVLINVTSENSQVRCE